MKRLLEGILAGALFLGGLGGCVEKTQMVEHVPSPVLKKLDLGLLPSFYNPKKSNVEKPNFEALKRWKAKTWGDWWYVLLNHPYRGEEKGRDFWQSPKTTIEWKGGDCEDYAILSIFYNGEGWGKNMLIISGKSRGKDGKLEDFHHAVHLRFKDGKYGIRGGSKNEEVDVKYGLDEALVRYQEQHSDWEIEEYRIFNLENFEEGWETTERNLKLDYIKALRKSERQDYPKREKERKEGREMKDGKEK